MLPLCWACLQGPRISNQSSESPNLYLDDSLIQQVSSGNKTRSIHRLLNFEIIRKNKV